MLGLQTTDINSTLYGADGEALWVKKTENEFKVDEEKKKLTAQKEFTGPKTGPNEGETYEQYEARIGDTMIPDDGFVGQVFKKGEWTNSPDPNIQASVQTGSNVPEFIPGESASDFAGRMDEFYATEYGIGTNVDQDLDQAIFDINSGGGMKGKKSEMPGGNNYMNSLGGLQDTNFTHAPNSFSSLDDYLTGPDMGGENQAEFIPKTGAEKRQFNKSLRQSGRDAQKWNRANNPDAAGGMSTVDKANLASMAVDALHTVPMGSERDSTGRDIAGYGLPLLQVAGGIVLGLTGAGIPAAAAMIGKGIQGGVNYHQKDRAQAKGTQMAGRQLDSKIKAMSKHLVQKNF